MGTVVRLPIRHVRASAECSAASDSTVTPATPFSRASSARPNHRSPGIDFLARQELTMEGCLSPRPSVTAPVPPTASMTSSTVSNMAPLIVRKSRTSQVFATCEQKSSAACAEIEAMPDRTKLIAQRLGETRKALGFQEQSAFAKALGIGKSTYHPFESGERRISPTVAFRLRERFRIPLDWTYYGDARNLPEDVWEKLRKSA